MQYNDVLEHTGCEGLAKDALKMAQRLTLKSGVQVKNEQKK